jgi:two-component system NarL family response regulator
MKKIRILLADDHSLFREGLAGILASQPDFEVVAEAFDGLEAVVKAVELHPDLVLMDVQMPGLDGIEAAAQIKEQAPESVIVMLTVRDEPEKLFQAIKNGAQGYLLKSIRSREMIELLRSAVNGESPITPSMAYKMLEEFRRMSRIIPQDMGDDLPVLTDREMEVLNLSAEGLSDKEIAERLTVSLHTVKSHMRNILHKLHVSNRREAARLAKQRRII